VGLSVIDSSVLIAALTPSDTHHEQAVLALREARRHNEIVVPVVAFSEALVGPYRHNTRTGREFERDIMAVGRLEPATHEIGSLAARLRAQRQVKLPDALVVATANHLRAAEVLTFDERWRTLDRRVRCLS
jgi:predicted nucleic acid-binding protein